MFTEEEFAEKFQLIMKILLSEAQLVPPKHPRAVLLGGQSGAGKTMLHEVCLKKMDGGGLVINGDDYRSYHPRFQELYAEDGLEVATQTASWTGKMVEELIKALSHMGYNLVIEGTMRTFQVPMQTARFLKSRGYDVSLAIMAVKPEISFISCQIRHELMRIAGTTPRATDPSHHNRIVADIIENLRVLEQSHLFKEICLYSRSKTLLFPNENEVKSATEVLREVLFGEWTIEERQHYAFLQSKLDSMGIS